MSIWDFFLLCGMRFFKVGRFSLYGHAPTENYTILCMLGCSNSKWDTSPYSGTLLFEI